MNNMMVNKLSGVVTSTTKQQYTCLRQVILCIQ